MVAVMTASTLLVSMLVAAEPATAAVDSVKALDSAATISKPAMVPGSIRRGVQVVHRAFDVVGQLRRVAKC